VKEDIVKLVGDKLEELKVYIFDAMEEKEGKDTYLRIVIDSYEKDDIINIDRVCEATKIIDPIVEKADLIKGEYILDVYAKSKGDE